MGIHAKYGYCLALSLAYGCGSHSDPQPSVAKGRASELQPMPSIDLTDLNGRRWQTKDFKGRVVLVEFWATWCPPCLEVIPEQKKLYAKYKDKGLEVLAISTDSDNDVLKNFKKKNEFPYAVAWDNSETYKAWKVDLLPTSFLLRDGKVLGRWQGKDSQRDVEVAIETILRD